MRDNFLENTKQTLARRVAYRCSNPDCRAPTSGPHQDPTRHISVGEAAHITAAASGGPRFDVSLSSDQRRHAENGIWLCSICAKIIDDDEGQFPVIRLREWKAEAESEAQAAVGKPVISTSRLSTAQLSHLLTQLTASASDDTVRIGDEAAQVKIDDVKGLLEKGHALAARDILVRLRREWWEKVSATMRSKIVNSEGCAAFNLDDIASAEQHFSEALQYEPDNAKTLANLACVELISRRPEEALAHSARAHELAPEDENVTSAFLQALYQTGHEKQLEGVLTENLWIQTSRVCRAALASIAYECGEYRRCKELIESVIQSEPSVDRDPQLYFLLASALLNPVFLQLQQDLIDVRSLSSQERDTLQQAEAAYTQILKLVARRDGRHYFYAALVGRSGVRQLLGRCDDAIQDCERVLTEQPDHRGALENKGRALLHLDRAEEAITCLGALLNMGDACASEMVESEHTAQEHSDELMILLGTAYLHAGQPEQVLSLIPPMDPEKADLKGLGKAELRLYAAASLTHAAARDAEAKTIDYLQTTLAGEPAAHAILGQHAAYSGDVEGAISHYREALALASAPAKEKYRSKLAQYLYGQGQFDQAIPLFRLLVEGREDHPALSAFTVCLYNIGEFSEAREMASRVRATGGARAVVSEIEATILEKGGDLEEAASVWRELIEVEPQNHRHRARLAFLTFRQGEEPEARHLVERIPYEAVKNDVDLLINLARLRHLLGLSESLRYSYRARKIAFGDAQTHFDYMNCCLHLGGDEAERAMKEHRSVEAGDAVYLLRDGNETILVLEDEEPYNTERGDLRPDDRRTGLLVGRRRGEKVILRESIFGPEEYEITAVKTKFLHASHETTRMFEKGTLEHSSFQVADVRTPDKVEQLWGFLDRHSGGVDFEEMYRTEPIPFAIYARQLHRPILEVWLSLTNYPTAYILAFDGTEEDRARQRRLLNDDQAFVSLDLMALLTIVHLSLEDAVCKRFGRIVLGRPVMDELRQYEQEIQSNTQSHGIMGSVRGERFYLETPPEYTVRKKEMVRRLLEFVRKPAVEVVASMPLLDMENNYRQGLGDPALAAILAAAEHRTLFYTDDLRLRQIAQGLWDVEGIDSQGVLTDLRRRGIIGQEFFENALARATLANYHSLEDANGVTNASGR